MDVDENTGLVKQVASLTDAGRKPFDLDHGRKGFVLPTDYHFQVVDPLHRVLSHVSTTEQFLTAASFADYVIAFKLNNTRVFGDYRKPRLKAVFDYHIAEGDQNTEQYCAHAAVFEPPRSEQWARWSGVHGQPMSQGDFAEFIEENYEDVQAPDHGDLLDMVANLHAKKNVSFSSGVRLQDGSNELSYGEDVQAKVGKGKITVPNEITLGIPVIFAGQAYKVRVLLRYRITDAGLVFIVKINRKQFLEQQAFEDVIVDVEKSIGQPVLLGMNQEDGGSNPPPATNLTILPTQPERKLP